MISRKEFSTLHIIKEFSEILVLIRYKYSVHWILKYFKNLIYKIK